MGFRPHRLLWQPSVIEKFHDKGIEAPEEQPTHYPRCCLQAVQSLRCVMQALAAALEATHSMRVCLALCFAMLAHFGAAEPPQGHGLVRLVRASFGRLPPLPGLFVAQLLLLMSYAVLSANHPDKFGTVRLALFGCLLG